MINISLSNDCLVTYDDSFKKYLPALFKQLTVDQKEYFYWFSSINQICFPIGYSEVFIRKLNEHQISFQLEDKRIESQLSFDVIRNPNWSPRNYQKEAVDVLSRDSFGSLNAPTGSGKTQIAIYLIEKLKQKTLIVVPTSDLVSQTIERIKQIMVFDYDKYLGQYAGTKKEIKEITIGTWQSISKNLNGFKDFGMVIADEFHKSGAKNYFHIINNLTCKHKYGISATPKRYEDTVLLSFLFGKVKHKIEIEDLYQAGYLIRPEIYFVNTGFEFKHDLDQWQVLNLNDIQKLSIIKSQIANDEERNKWINYFIEKHQMKINMVLTYERDHAEWLYNYYCFGKKILLHGGLKGKDRKKAFQEIENSDEITIFGTQSLLGEGIDIPKLECLFLCSPTGAGNKTIQFTGRILRPHKNKSIVKVFDFVDSGVVENMKWSRKREYDKLSPVFKNVANF